MDIFSAGCIFYYILSAGLHPFGERYKQQSNIINGDFNIGSMNECEGRCTNFATFILLVFLEFFCECLSSLAFFLSAVRPLQFLEQVFFKFHSWRIYCTGTYQTDD